MARPANTNHQQPDRAVAARSANEQAGPELLSAVLEHVMRLLEPLIEQTMERTLTEYLGEVSRRRLLTDREITVEVLSCSTETLRNRLLPAGLPHLLVGEARRYDRDEVIAWLRARR